MSEKLNYSTSALLLLRDEITLFNRISGNSQMSTRAEKIYENVCVLLKSVVYVL